jgi:hypothetical protein
MSKRERKSKLVGPWRNVHGAVWLIGLVVLAVNNWWWPGILVLVAISMLLEGVIMLMAPDAVEYEGVESPSPQEPSTPGPSPVPAPEHRFELLPTTCPNCGGPIRGHEVTWTGAQSADCPYCGANLPMKS